MQNLEPWQRRIRTLLLLLILASAFTLRLTVLTTYETLPGWDPSSHISKAVTVVSSGHLETELFWYPPGFHFLLAILFLFTGVTTISQPSFMLIKLLMATISALQVLVVYLVGRKVYGSPTVGLIGAILMTVSLRQLEMLGWGGYPNITGMLFLGLSLYLLSAHYQPQASTNIAILTAIFGLILSHSISTFVFVAIILFHLFSFSLISRRPPRREILAAAFSLLIVFGFYIAFAREHMLFILSLIAGYSPHISTTNQYVETFGEIPAYLTPLGTLSTLLFARERKEKQRELALLISWILVPFILFQTNFIARFANRFSYFMTYPMTFLSAFALKFTAEKTYPRITGRTPNFPQSSKGIIALALCLILSISGTNSLISGVPARASQYASYYLVCSLRDYDASIFARARTLTTANILAAYPADPWISILTERKTSQADVESVNFSMENAITAVQETDPYNVGRNPALYLKVGGESYEALRLKDKDLRIEFVTHDSERHSIDLSEAYYEKVQWFKRSSESISLRYIFKDRFFTLEKFVTIRNTSPLVEFRYRITPNSQISSLSLTLNMVLNRDLQYYSLFIPGFFPWLNPWDNPTTKDRKDQFAYVSFPFTKIKDRFFALFDEDKPSLLAIRLGVDPFELTIGARSDRLIDSVKATYRYGSVSKGEQKDLSFDILATPLPQHTATSDMSGERILSLLEQNSWTPLESSDYSEVVASTPATYIQGREGRLPSAYLYDPHFDRIFDNGLSNLYAFHRTA